MTRFELEDRLVNFSVDAISIIKSIPKTEISKFLCDQLLRSSCAPALIYSEALSAESRRDFRHKLSLVLKELRESYSNLRIMRRTGIITEDSLVNECNELISIFTKSVQSLDRNSANGSKGKKVVKE